MAKTKRTAGKGTGKAGRPGLRVLKSGGSKAGKPGLRKPKSTKPEPRKRKPFLPSETARLKRRLKTARMQQQASAEILRAVLNASGDAARPLQQIAEITARLFGAPSVSIQLAEDGEFTQEYRVGAIAQRIGSAYPRSNIRVGGPNMPGTVVFENRQIHIPDLDHLDPSMSDWPGLPHARAGGCRTLCGTPLRRQGEAIGALMIFRDRLLPFTDEELAVQQSFADQAVIAIENARLFDEVQAKTRDLSEALTYQTGSSNILSVIASSPTDVEPVLKAIVENACLLCDAYDALVRLKVGDYLYSSAHHGPLPINTNKWLINRSWTGGRAVIDKRPVHVHDVLSAEGDEFPEAQEMARLQRNRTILAVPLLREGDCIGVIVLRRNEVNPFSDKQIALLQTFADQAVIALGNVRLFDEVQAKTRDLAEALQQQTATSEVLKVISSSPGELEPVFRSMLENAVNICDAKFGNLLLVDGNRAHWEAGLGTPPKLADFFSQLSWFEPTPGSHVHRVMRTKQVSHTADDLAEPVVGAAARFGGARSTVCVPMVKDDVLVGTIFIYRTEVRPFTDKQIDLVKNFAAQAVIAIDNARLLKELRQRTDDLTKSLDDLRTAQDRLVQTEKLASLGQLTAGIAHEIKNPLNFVNNFSVLSAELIDELDQTLRPAPLDQKMRGDVGELTQMLKSNLGKVVQHGKRADSIVKNMLLHSREGSGEHRSADINALVEESLNLAYHGARAEKPGFNIMLKRDLDPDAGACELYPQEITRALLNLISNGFYAATQRKSVEGETFEPVLIAATKNRGKTVEIRIRDNGTGIPPEVREKMFNPFFTTKPAGEGTGLGLSMSHDIIVKQHGGRIDVETEAGQFTEFTILLPRAGASLIKSREQR